MIIIINIVIVLIYCKSSKANCYKTQTNTNNNSVKLSNIMLLHHILNSVNKLIRLAIYSIIKQHLISYNILMRIKCIS